MADLNLDQGVIIGDGGDGRFTIRIRQQEIKCICGSNLFKHETSWKLQSPNPAEQMYRCAVCNQLYAGLKMPKGNV